MLKSKIYLFLPCTFFLVIFLPVFAEESENLVIDFTTDKLVYTNDDFIKILGNVSEKTKESAMIIIFDPFGNPTGIYPVIIDSDNQFSVEFLAKAGVNFKVDGTYSIDANYAGIKNTIFFEFFEKIPEQEHPANENVIENESTEDVSTENKSTEDVSTENESTEDVSTENESMQENMLNKVEENQNDEQINEYNKNLDKKNESNEIVKTVTLEKNDENEEEEKINKETFDNLSVEDIELGEMLNRIYLDCDDNVVKYDVLYYDGMGPSLTRLCKYQEALSFYDDTLIKDSTNIEALTNKGTVLSKLGHYNEALIFYNAALDENSEYVPALNNKANVLYETNNFEEAKSIYEKVLEIEPSHFLAKNNLVQLNEKFSGNDVAYSNKLLSDDSKEVSSSLNENILKKQNQRNIFDQINNVISSFFRNFFN